MRANKLLLHGDITASIIDSFFEVHKDLGFGFREYIAVAVPFQSTVQLPFPENGASVTSISLRTLHRRVPQVSDREVCFGMRCGV